MMVPFFFRALMRSPQTAALLVASLASLVPVAAGALQGEPAPGPNIVLVCIDTLRADRLGCYGHSRDTTPNLDRLAARGVRFSRAWSASTWTLPSVSSTFSGVAPERHGADHFLARMSPQAWLLASVLEERGYQTAGVVGNHFLQPDFGLSRGFDGYQGDCLVDRDGINSDCLTDQALGWLQDEARPGFFLYLHYFDPHYNFHEHEGFSFGGEDTERVWSGQDIWELRDLLPDLDEKDRARLDALYDSEVAFTDHHLGRVLDALRTGGFADDTWVLVTSDHGEALGEHGWVGHTVEAHEPIVRVPLLVAGPGVVPGTWDGPVQLVDLLPTLLDLVGERAPPYGLCGRSLRPILQGERGPPSPRDVYLSVRTRYMPPARTRESILPRHRIDVEPWRLFADTAEDGSVSYRIFKMDEPEGLRKKDPADHPEKVAELAGIRDQDLAQRLAEFDREEARRVRMVRDLRGMIRWPFKYLQDQATGVEQLFDLDQDPDEQQDLSAARPELLLELRACVVAEFERREATALEPAPPLTDEELDLMRARLGAMGYTER